MTKDWLLCDFHIHTTFSDGSLPLKDVVDLYGKHGFDVIAITDHILDRYTIEKHVKSKRPINAIKEEEFKEYMKILWNEAKRVWKEYKMLLIPGVELTNNFKRYHILAIDIKEYIDPTLPVNEIVRRIKEQNAIAIAAHPDRKKTDKEHHSWYLWENQERFRNLFDAWELANRDDLFNSIGVKKYNYVANSDFHEPCHLYSWKTLIKTEKNIEAVKDAIRKNENVALYLMRNNDK